MVIFSCAIKSDWYFIQNLLQLYIMTVFTHLKQLYFRTCGRQVSKVIDNDPHPCIIPSPWEWWESENRWDVTPLILLQYMAKGSCNYYRIGKWVDIILEEADPVRWAFKNMVSSLTVCVLAAQSCLTLCDPMDYSLPRSSVHEILQATILEWVTICFSRGSSRPRNGTRVSCIAGRFFTIWATREAHNWLWRKKANSHVVSYLERRAGVSRSWEWFLINSKQENIASVI